MIALDDDFETQMNKLVHDVGGIVNISVDDRQKVTKVGALAMQKVIEEETKKSHFNSGRDTSKFEHLADSVTSGRLAGTRIDGTSAVGFSTNDVNHARIARFLNDGTIKMPGDSFYDQAIETAKEPVFMAEAAALAKIQEKKGL